MELVPILSTIILVGTIATFILAVAAYVLYKIRERRAQEERSTTAAIQQEPHVLVTPQQQPALAMASQAQPAQTSVYITPPAQPAATVITTQAPAQVVQPLPQPQPSVQNSLFWEYTDEGFVPVRPEEERASQEEQQANQADDGYAWL